MDMKQLTIGTIIGGVTLYVTGYVLFDLLAGDFYAANINAAPGLMRDTQVMWAMALGNLALALLITIGMVSAAGPITMASGAKTGAIYAFLAWMSADFILYGILNLTTLNLVGADAVLEPVHGGISGAVIAIALSKLPKTATA